MDIQASEIEKVIDILQKKVDGETIHRDDMMKRFKSSGEIQMGRIQAWNYSIFNLKKLIDPEGAVSEVWNKIAHFQ